MTLPHRNPVIATMASLSRDLLKGKEEPVRLAMIALLTGGHILIEDIPGLGKTTLALALSGVLGLSFGRIQCTSDLLPSDITGLSIYDRQSGGFRFIGGPIFNQIVLVDEINRAMPKTQSALLEAMEEGRVTLEGVTHHLPAPFLVIATQNPLEQTGTYPLPESQMDRFLIRTGIGYPPAALEKEIIREGGIRETLSGVTPLIDASEIEAAKREIGRTVRISPILIDYLHEIVTETRRRPEVAAGISTRGAIGLAAAARAHAWLDGRDYVIPEDIRAMAPAVLPHRLLLRGSAGESAKEGIIRAVLDSIPVPIV